MTDPENGEWHPVAEPDAVSEDIPLAVTWGDDEIALYKVGDEYFATSNICTHGLARLSDGYLEGYLIECPLHQGLFDVRTGSCAGPPVEEDIKAYDVRVQDGKLEVRTRKP